MIDAREFKHSVVIDYDEIGRSCVSILMTSQSAGASKARRTISVSAATTRGVEKQARLPPYATPCEIHEDTCRCPHKEMPAGRRENSCRLIVFSMNDLLAFALSGGTIEI